jgi:CRISPR-associated protein Csd1
MILAALNEYYTRLQESDPGSISVPGYSAEKISYEIVLGHDGSVLGVNDLRELTGKNLIPKTLSVPASFKRPGTGAKSFFLWDKTSYVLGISATSKRCQEEHAAFKVLHQQSLAGTDDSGLRALLAFLGRWEPGSFPQSPHFAAHGDAFADSNIVFRLQGDTGLNDTPRYLHQRPAAEAAWSHLQANGDSGIAGTCLVTGRQAAIARLHPAIKGVNGAQSSGASIVSFNLDSFTSYGKTQGENAPVSDLATFSYTTALNHLLRRGKDNSQRLTIGDATVVFWAQAAKQSEALAAESLFAAFMNPSDSDDQETERLRSAMVSVSEGRPLESLAPDLRDDTHLFILALAPNASRLSIRFWETDTLAHFAKRLAQHYEDLHLEPAPWRAPPAVWKLQLAIAPSRRGSEPKSDDVPPQLAGELTRAILTGSPYPYYLLSAIVMRFRADGDLSGTRVALCKAVLARATRLGYKGITKGAPPVSLDPDNLEPGYLLGRLFSTLENTQQAALGKQINSTIRDRYYGAASATPASVFPLLLRNAQHHLSRLRKDKPGFAVQLEKDIGAIVEGFGTTFPRNLGIEAQGHFAIGYYHQTQARFNRKSSQDDAGASHNTDE